MLAIARYILLIALRDKLFFGMVLGIVAVSYLSYILGATALVEERQTAVTLAAGTSRFVVMLGLMVFVCFHIRRAFDSREMDVQVARPIRRTTLVFGYFLGFVAIAVALCLPMLLALAWMQPASWEGFAAYGTSLIAEALLATVFAMFAAFTLKSPVNAVLASCAFYVLSRLMGFFLITLFNHPPFSNVIARVLSTNAIDAVAYVLPRLDLFAKSAWLHYGASAHEWLLFGAQSLVFIPLLLCATMLDIRRKAF